MIIKAGCYYKNKKNNKYYFVHFLALQITNNIEIDVVVYSDMHNENQFYTRSTEEFFDKFKETE